MSAMETALDWASKGLTLLLVLLAVVFVAWQCFEGLARITTIGAEFRHFIVNRRNFDRWKAHVETETRRDNELYAYQRHYDAQQCLLDLDPGSDLLAVARRELDTAKADVEKARNGS